MSSENLLASCTDVSKSSKVQDGENSFTRWMDRHKPVIDSRLPRVVLPPEYGRRRCHESEMCLYTARGSKIRRMYDSIMTQQNALFKGKVQRKQIDNCDVFAFFIGSRVAIGPSSDAVAVDASVDDDAVVLFHESTSMQVVLRGHERVQHCFAVHISFQNYSPWRPVYTLMDFVEYDPKVYGIYTPDDDRIFMRVTTELASEELPWQSLHIYYYIDGVVDGSSLRSAYAPSVEAIF